MQGRYSYKGGTSSNGLVIYNDLFAYSHHGTDPASGKLCNAFDLCRIHLFGELDTKGSYSGKSPSFAAMERKAMDDKRVKTTLSAEELAKAKDEFSGLDDLEDASTGWEVGLTRTKAGDPESTANNIMLILENDPLLKESLRYNEFDSRRYMTKRILWKSGELAKPQPKGLYLLDDTDYSGLRNYIERRYGIVGSAKIDDALAVEFQNNTFHPVRDYLKSLEWDGTERIKMVLPDFFGCEDTDYTHLVFSKFLLGAVARVMYPGIKFDLVFVLVGLKQGVGKSYLFDKLARLWFSDSFLTVSGKEAFEQLQGNWVIEIAELSGLRKADVEAIKHFISKREDKFRKAYGRTVETYPRQCVFAGTTNNRDFLKDPTGNRRFLPVDVVESNIKKDIFTELTDADVDQIWAEAFHRFKQGERIYLDSEESKTARVHQLSHSESDERLGLVLDYLDKKLPTDWDGIDIDDRRMYLSGVLSSKGVQTRQYVCSAEIWCECLGRDKSELNRYNTREINELLRGLDEWQPAKSTKNFKHYGRQKYYERK
jgi:predicted P-loop ATPase